MEIKSITKYKKQFLELLLLADEEERMIDKYLDRGEMYTLYDENELRSLCVVTNEGEGVYEIKNLATYVIFQRMGYARYLIEFVSSSCKDRNATTLIVGTGYGTSTVDFYKKCGFEESHIIKNFFTDNYSNPIFESGMQLTDMIYLKKDL